MKSTKVKIVAFVCTIIMAFSSVSYAHGGKTDSSGGHKDNKNASGLGSYHFHHGYSAHLHPNGICPYSSVPEPSIARSSDVDSSYVQTPKAEDPEIVATDIRTWINGSEIPTFAYTGKNSGAVIIAEDLQAYGFDVTWQQSTNTLTITQIPDKVITPIAMDYYKGLVVGSHCYDINGSAKVVLKYGDNSYLPSLVYRLNGYIAISVDELKCFGAFEWDGVNRKVKINS